MPSPFLSKLHLNDLSKPEYKHLGEFLMTSVKRYSNLTGEEHDQQKRAGVIRVLQPVLKSLHMR